MVATFTDVNFPLVHTLFDEKGELLEPAYRKYVESAYEELLWMTRVLKYGREHLS